MYIFFLISVQYFVIKLCTGVLSITLIVTNTKTFLTSCPALQRVHFGTYFGILRLLFENRSICSHEILYRCSWCSFEGHCTIFFSISWPCWGFLGSVFGYILGNVPLILQKQSIILHETLYRCSLYNLDGQYTKKCFLYHVPLFWGQFLGIFGFVLSYLPLFLENCSGFSILDSCFWFCTFTNFFFFFFFFFSHHAPICWSPFYSNLGPILCIFFHVFRNSQYFMMIFCTQLLGNTLLASKQKNMLGQPVLETFWGVLGAFWSILFKETTLYFNKKLCALTFSFEKETNMNRLSCYCFE